MDILLFLKTSNTHPVDSLILEGGCEYRYTSSFHINHPSLHPKKKYIFHQKVISTVGNKQAY
jgi:hypothetical protein